MTQQPSKWAPPSPTIRVGVLGLFAAFLLAVALALAPRAEAYVYWNSESGIGRANLDGTAVDESFIDLRRPAPGSIAVDARHIYWIQRDGIGRAKLDGTGVDRRFIPESIDVNFAPRAALAVDENHIYWTENSLTELPAASIGRANLDGTDVEDEFIRFVGLVSGVAVDDNYIYWREAVLRPASPPGGAIGRAKIDGTDVNRHFIPTNPFMTEGGGLAVDAEHVYWLNAVGEPTGPSPIAAVIARANLDGTAIDESLIATDPLPTDLAVDAKHLYWLNQAGYPSEWAASISRANLDGTGVDQGFIARARNDSATSIAIDGGTDRMLAGKASAKKTQRQKGGKLLVKVKVNAKERLTAKATGRIKLNHTYKLKPKKVKLAAGETSTLKVKPKKAKAKQIARALKRGEKATARVKVKLTDRAANTEIEKLRVTLKQRRR